MSPYCSSNKTTVWSKYCLRSLMQCLLLIVPVVPLLSKHCTGLNTPVLTECVLKKEMGKKGISSNRVMVEGLMRSPSVNFLYNGFSADCFLNNLHASSMNKGSNKVKGC